MNNTNQTIQVGSVITIPAGKRVNRAGVTVTRQVSTQVTVRNVVPDRRGKVRVFWKSNGVMANALI